MDTNLEELETNHSVTELVGGYRDRKVELGFHLLATSFFALALFPALMHREGTAWGVLFTLTSLSLSLLVLWKSPSWYLEYVWIDCTSGLIRKISALKRGFGDNEILRTWETVLGEVRDISAITVKPRRSLWNPSLVWDYPIVLLTGSGREITFTNDDCVSNDYERANSIASFVAQRLNLRFEPLREDAVLRCQDR